MMESSVPFTMNVEPSGCNNDNSGWGGDWGAWIILFLIFGMFGWGGFGGWGGGFGGNGGALQGYATQSDIQRGFDNSAVVTKLDGITQGICDSTYALNNAITNGFNNTNMGMMQGFNGVDRSICNLSSQLAQCCCDTQRAIDGVNYNATKNTCDLQNTMNNNTRDLLENQNSNTRAVLDFLTQDKIATLTAENQSLKFQASQTAQNAYIAANQDAQTAELIRRLGADCPTPAYVVQPPTPVNFPTNCCGQFTGWGNGYNNGCGNCGGCGSC